MGVRGSARVTVRLEGENAVKPAVNDARADIQGLEGATLKLKTGWAGVAAGAGLAAIAVQGVANAFGAINQAAKEGGAAADRITILERGVRGYRDILEDAKRSTAGIIPVAKQGDPEQQQASPSSRSGRATPTVPRGKSKSRNESPQ